MTEHAVATCTERIYAVNLSVLVYVDPDGLPPEDSDEFREIMAEHVIDFINHAIDASPSELANTCIDTVDLVKD